VPEWLTILRLSASSFRVSYKRLLPAAGLALAFESLVAVFCPRSDATDRQSTETTEEAVCRMVDSAATSAGLPVGLLTRLIWTESRFRSNVTSSAGAQGVAQFMPETAAERGLIDPYDPEQAIPQAARLLVDLEQQFGNIGWATAAYNAGPARVASWLGHSGSLPYETQVYVFTLTGRTVEDWAAAGRQTRVGGDDPRSCIDVTAALRADERADEPPMAPWGVQLAGNFSKAIALASFERARQRYSSIVGAFQAMVVGATVRSRGTRRFYRVLIPAASRSEAEKVCQVILAAGGACVALRS
jgi:hypothetical protein